MNYLTYILNFQKKIELSTLKTPLNACPLSTASFICGHTDNSDIQVFENGEVRIHLATTGNETEDFKNISKELSHLMSHLKEQGIDLDVFELIKKATVIRGEVSPALIEHMDFAEFRPKLGSKVPLNLWRLLVYVGLSGDESKRGEKTMFSIGKLLGSTVYGSKSRDIQNRESAFNVLSQFMEKNKIGILTQVKQKNNEVLRFELKESLSSSGNPNIEKTTCNFERGIFSGFYSKFFEKSVQVREISCWSSGESLCTFSLTL